MTVRATARQGSLRGLVIRTLNDHPRSGDLKRKVKDLRSTMGGGDMSMVEEQVFELMRAVNDLESSAM